MVVVLGSESLLLRLSFVEGLDICVFGRWVEGDAMLGRCKSGGRVSVLLDRSISKICQESKRKNLEIDWVSQDRSRLILGEECAAL